MLCILFVMILKTFYLHSMKLILVYGVTRFDREI